MIRIRISSSRQYTRFNRNTRISEMIYPRLSSSQLSPDFFEILSCATLISRVVYAQFDSDLS